jgi:DNA-binding MarR family transcriptional regulator
MAILEQAGAITMSDFAQQLNLPLSTATNRVERLVKLGLVSRGRSESDRRIVEVSLSPKGRQIVTVGHQVRLAMGRGMLAALTPAERLTFLELMQKMSDNVTR